MGVLINEQGKRFSIPYGNETLVFERLNRFGGRNSVLIKVDAEARVKVLAPGEASDASVIDAVKKRARWIYEQCRDFKQLNEQVSPRQYISGETHFYLGKQYLLKVTAACQPHAVKLTRGQLQVSLPKPSPIAVEKTLNDWYRARAKIVFSERLLALAPQALWLSELPSIRVQTMKTQWGSCSPQGRITLNPHLIKAPKDCIDYVLLHELCHLVEHNHSEKFYRLLAQVMPKWESVKERLDKMAFRILA